MRDPTDREKRWWSSLRRLLKAMPDTIEILIGAQGQVGAAPRGETLRTLNKTGNADNVPRLLLPDIIVSGVVENGGSL